MERSGTVAIRFIPRQSGLTQPWVTVLNLVAHSNYSFRILATNAVTLQSNEPSLYAIANITTNQAGRAPQSVRMHTSQTAAHRHTTTLLTCLNNVEQLGFSLSPQSVAPG